MRAFTLAAVAVAVSVSCSGHAAERANVRAYLEAIRPLVKEGGRIVQQGVKPGISDLESSKVTPEQFRAQAAAWRAEMQDARQKMGRVPAPGRLASVSAIFDRSLGGYVEAIDAFVVASTQPSLAAIKDAVTRAIPIAEAADRTYDSALAALKAEQRRVGVPEEVP